MSVLNRQAAARELRISLWKFDQITKDGIGKVRAGRRGRSHAALYDTNAIAALLSPSLPMKRRQGIAEQLERGALALTLADVVTKAIRMIQDTGELYAYGVPHEKQKLLVRYLEQRMKNTLADHLKIKYLRSSN